MNETDCGSDNREVKKMADRCPTDVKYEFHGMDMDIYKDFIPSEEYKMTEYEKGVLHRIIAGRRSVEPKHGRWIFTEYESGDAEYCCSECGEGSTTGRSSARIAGREWTEEKKMDKYKPMLIDANEIVTTIFVRGENEKTKTGTLVKIPIADALDKWTAEGCPKPIESKPKRGKWINGKCSECGGDAPLTKVFYKGELMWEHKPMRNFCPMCGAEMDNASTNSVDMPTDAVEVVRCKDCKHNGTWYCMVNYGADEIMPMDNDNFCSWGERKDGGENDTR